MARAAAKKKTKTKPRAKPGATKKRITGTPQDPTVSAVIRFHDPRQIEAFTDTEAGHDKWQSVAADQLKATIERVERLEAERREVIADIKDIFAEAKGNGFDTKVLRKLLSLRKMDRDVRAEFEAVLELYQQALGMT